MRNGQGTDIDIVRLARAGSSIARRAAHVDSLRCEMDSCESCTFPESQPTGRTPNEKAHE